MSQRIQRARELRRSATDAEQHLWRHLRKRQIAGHHFRRQHPVAEYFVDFACLEMRLVVELDGGQHLDTRAYDDKRTARLEKLGFRVLRFWNDDVMLRTDCVLEVIWRALVER